MPIIKKGSADNFMLMQREALQRADLSMKAKGALMSRLWTGFFGTARCRYPEKFSKPGFQPKMA